MEAPRSAAATRCPGSVCGREMGTSGCASLGRSETCTCRGGPAEGLPACPFVALAPPFFKKIDN